MSTDDYYSYRPLLILPRPLALVGIPGAEVGKTGRAINLLSGVPFVWVDRQVEHRLGRSVELVEHELGETARTEVERRVVEEALTQRTPPVLALSDVTYADEELARRLEQAADVVLLHVDVQTALARIAARAARDPRHHFALRDAGRADAERIRQRLEELERRVRHLSRVILVRDRTPLEVAQELLQSLGMTATA